VWVAYALTGSHNARSIATCVRAAARRQRQLPYGYGARSFSAACRVGCRCRRKRSPVAPCKRKRSVQLGSSSVPSGRTKRPKRRACRRVDAPSSTSPYSLSRRTPRPVRAERVMPKFPFIRQFRFLLARPASVRRKLCTAATVEVLCDAASWLLPEPAAQSLAPALPSVLSPPAAAPHAAVPLLRAVAAAVAGGARLRCSLCPPSPSIRTPIPPLHV